MNKSANIKSIVSSMVKKANHFINNKTQSHKKNDFDNILKAYLGTGVPNALDFNFDNIKSKVLEYVREMKVGKKIGIYKYSFSCTKPNIYNSTFACLIYDSYSSIDDFSKTEKLQWIQYLNSFQCEKDGLFYDQSIINENYKLYDWWGARHLIPLVISALHALGGHPRYEFKFLEWYYNEQNLQRWLQNIDLNSNAVFSTDIDNKIMNICVALQYSRDINKNTNAKKAVKIILDYLFERINPKTGLWGNNSFKTDYERSRAVQFAYHLFIIFNYDHYNIPHIEKILDNVLQTQNMIGGYGVTLNSSGCEDIDSIELLIRFSEKIQFKDEKIRYSLLRALPWVLTNMNEDGGFVFRKNEAFVYGHEEMSSKRNESSLFATWFRSLSLVYLTEYLKIQTDYKFQNIPGYSYNI